MLPGSCYPVRFASTQTHSTLSPNVAFKTPGGKGALLVANPGTTPQNFAVRYKGKAFTTSLNAGSVGTYVW